MLKKKGSLVKKVVLAKEIFTYSFVVLSSISEGLDIRIFDEWSTENKKIPINNGHGMSSGRVMRCKIENISMFTICCTSLGDFLKN